jgi:endoglucanase
MDLSGLYPWSANSPKMYIAAYRHVVSIFRDEGVTNVRWVWSPAGDPKAPEYYPGDDVVDYVGLTLLEDAGWNRLFALPEQSFADAFSSKYDVLKTFGKPIIICELGISGSAEHQKSWLAQAAASVSDFPLLRGLVYFNDINPRSKQVPTRPDWRLTAQGFAALDSAADLTAQPTSVSTLVANSGFLAATLQAPQAPGLEVSDH